MASSSKLTLRSLPLPLQRFVYGTIALAALCVVTVVFCRDVLHLTYPYDTPVLTPRFNYHDYWMFTDRFHQFHSTGFFTKHAEFIFSYPAPMAVLYKLTYVVTDESTRGFLCMMALTFALATVLMGRALRRADVEIEPVVALMATALLLSDPIWFELNRANLEFYLWVFITIGVWLFFRGKGYSAAACFGTAGAMKLFPLVYFGLLIAKKQYKQTVFGLAVAAAVMLGSLWLLCPNVLFAWHTLSGNANEFGRIYLYQRLWREVGFDHSLFALIKMLWRQLPGPAVMNRVLTTYMMVTALGGTALFFARIRCLPVVNQLVCLTTASVLLPPSSSDYTLIHLYAPWAALVFVAIDAARANVSVPGLGVAFACLTVLLSPESEMFFRHERGEGMIKAIALLVLWYAAMKFPFELSRAPDSSSSTAAASPGLKLHESTAQAI